MEPLNQRQGFLVSAIVHLTVLMILISGPALDRSKPVEPVPDPPKESARVFIPPAETLRQILPAPVRPRATPPTPAPASNKLKDHMSMGAVPLRQPNAIIPPDVDFTKAPKGRPDAVRPGPDSLAPPATPRPAPPAAPLPDAETESSRQAGLRLPPGIGREIPRGEALPKGSKAPERRSIASQLRELDKNPGVTGTLGIPTGTAQKLGPMLFDPLGADFSLWGNHFTREIYRNWIMPPAFEMGVQGMVTLEFTLDRNGTVLSCHVLQPSGFPAYDRAAKNAIESARALPLPSDYPAETLTIKVGFLYNLRDAPASP